MAANGIDESHRDDFVRHAVKFDDDDNQYLKKAEIEAAAAAWGSDDSEAEEEAPEEVPEDAGEDATAGSEDVEEASEEAVEEVAEEEPAAEEATEEVAEESAEEATGKDCPICGAPNSADAINCSECGFEF